MVGRRQPPDAEIVTVNSVGVRSKPGRVACLSTSDSISRFSLFSHVSVPDGGSAASLA
jgi:hypothetical protein